MKDKELIQLGADVKVAAAIGDYLNNASNSVAALANKNPRFSRSAELYDQLMEEIIKQCDDGLKDIQENNKK